MSLVHAYCVFVWIICTIKLLRCVKICFNGSENFSKSLLTICYNQTFCHINTCNRELSDHLQIQLVPFLYLNLNNCIFILCTFIPFYFCLNMLPYTIQPNIFHVLKLIFTCTKYNPVANNSFNYIYRVSRNTAQSFTR